MKIYAVANKIDRYLVVVCTVLYVSFAFKPYELSSESFVCASTTFGIQIFGSYGAIR